MNATKITHRQAASRIQVALTKRGIRGEFKAAGTGSLYLTIETADGDTLTLRVADHPAPAWGGFRQNDEGTGERGGRADLCVNNPDPSETPAHEKQDITLADWRVAVDRFAALVADEGGQAPDPMDVMIAESLAASRAWAARILRDGEARMAAQGID